jgi:hypothetical protein
LNAFYGTALSQHMAKLPDGSLLCRGAIVARTGFQDYLPSELEDFAGQLPGGVKAKNGKIRVLRPASEVFDPASVASYEAAPLTDSHPPQFLAPSNWRAWASGHAQHVREGPRLDNGDRSLIADLVVRDPNLIDKIERGLKRQISCGYSCVYELLDDGTLVQTAIRGNHIAVLEKGRAQNAQILDHATEWDENEVMQQMMAARAEDAANYAAQMKRFHRRPL